MTELNREQLLGHIDRVYKSLNSVARFVRADKMDLNNPMDVRMLHNLSIATRGLSEGIDPLLAPPLERKATTK